MSDTACHLLDMQWVRNHYQSELLMALGFESGLIARYEANETPWGRAAQLSWLDLLAGLCYLMTRPLTVGHCEESITIIPLLVCSRQPWQRRMNR